MLLCSFMPEKKIPLMSQGNVSLMSLSFASFSLFHSVFLPRTHITSHPSAALLSRSRAVAAMCEDSKKRERTPNETHSCARAARRSIKIYRHSNASFCFCRCSFHVLFRIYFFSSLATSDIMMRHANKELFLTFKIILAEWSPLIYSDMCK